MSAVENNVFGTFGQTERIGLLQRVRIAREASEIYAHRKQTIEATQALPLDEAQEDDLRNEVLHDVRNVYGASPDWGKLLQMLMTLLQFLSVFI